MRKVLILLLSLCIAFSFLACGKEHSLGDDILRGDQLDVVLLTAELAVTRSKDLAVILLQFFKKPLIWGIISCRQSQCP